MHRSLASQFTACACFPCLALLPALATAVPIPDLVAGDNAAAQRQEQYLEQLRERNEAHPDVRLQNPPTHTEQRLPTERPCHVIHHVRLTGDLSGLPALSDALSGPSGVDSPEGRCLGAAGIAMLAQRAQNALFKLGFITSHVHAHPQPLLTGELVLTIEAGRIGELREFGMGTAIPRFTAAQAIRRGKILNLRDIEQTLENLRRNPDALVAIRISPGKLPGESDILIEYVPRKSLRLKILVDDSGSMATGKTQASATIGWNDPLHLADYAFVSAGRDAGSFASGSPGAPGHEYAMFHYSVPMGYWLLSASANLSRQHRALSSSLEGHLYHEASNQGEISLSRVLRRGPDSKTSASLKTYMRRARSMLDDTELEVQRRHTEGWEAAVRHTAYFGTGSTQRTLKARLALRQDTEAFGAAAAPGAQAGEDPTRARLIDSVVSLAMPFALDLTSAPHATAPRLQYQGQVRIRWSLGPLAPQDRLCIGGRHTVRGFDGERSLCGNRALVWRNEVSGLVGGLLGDLIGSQALRMYGAIDGGLASDRNNSGDAGSVLAGAVLGMRAEFPLAKYATLHSDAFIGVPLAQPAGFGAARLTAGFSVGADF